ncbi:hypothetical protein [Halorhodospira abdelmalekii]|uniref:hypothetical protein n=1 Tax=Halorhodospira abdelmalekii TaxID=421629 RepID=UPI001905D142|nr:hypothetical protein [Halorhodospira abdelmalekii]
MATKSQPNKQKQQGSILILAIFLIVLAAAASAAITHIAASSVQATSIRVDSERAFYAAESARLMSAKFNASSTSAYFELAPDLHACMIAPNTDPNEPDTDPPCGVANACGENENMYIGWVGTNATSWNPARARHALCADRGAPGAPGGSGNSWEDIEDWEQDFSESAPPGWEYITGAWGTHSNLQKIIVPGGNHPNSATHFHGDYVNERFLVIDGNFDYGGNLNQVHAQVCVRGNIQNIHKHSQFSNACYMGSNNSGENLHDPDGINMQPCGLDGCAGFFGSGSNGVNGATATWSYADF